MGHNKVGNVMLEAISMGVTDIHKMKEYKFIDMISEYLSELDDSNFKKDPIIPLESENVLMLKNILDIDSEQKLNKAKFDLAFSIYQENREELDEVFESKMSDFYNKEYKGEYFEI